MSDKNYIRFNPAERIEHWILFLSFTILAITGLPQKFASAGISQGMIAFFGGIETTRIIHRVAATIFVLEAIYHLVVLGYKLYVKRVQMSMLPGPKDAVDAIQSMAYNVGARQNPPKMGRYNFAEKAEYWAMLWGLILMGITGFMLWNPILTARILPGVFIPAAKVAHGWEAVLAVAAILLWHFYNVHIKSWNWSMIKGTMSHEQMEEEHRAELEQIEAGKAGPAAVPADVLRRRKLVYFPIATVVALALVFGVYWLVTAESTATATVPPPEPNIPVISTPIATAAPTAEPTQESAAPTEGAAAPTAEGATAPAAGGAALTWDGGVSQLFQSKCASCHGPAAMGGLAVDTYANLMKGGSSGPVIDTANPEGSKLVQVQQGSHPGMFSADELQQVIDWIKAGAPEK